MPPPGPSFIQYAPPTFPTSPSSNNSPTTAERRPLFSDQSPPLTPGSTSHFSKDDLRDEYSPEALEAASTIKSGLKARPPGPITPTVPLKLVEEESSVNNYRTDRQRQRRSFQRMDMEVQRMREKDSRLKRNIRRFRFVVRSAHLACSIVVISLLAANFAVFYRTQDHVISDDGEVEPAWGDTKTWPAIVLLSVACLSALLSVIVLLSYMKSVKWANRFATADASLMIAASVVFLLIWAVSAGIFHNREAPAFNVPNIWSWACNHKPSSDNTVNFNQICITQEWSFICAIIEVCLELLTIGSFLLIFVRMKSKSKVRKTEYATFAAANSMDPSSPGFNPYNDVPNTPKEAGYSKEAYGGQQKDLGVRS